MVTDSKIDSTRQFILSFFLSDDTLSIYEVAIPNSGQYRAPHTSRSLTTIYHPQQRSVPSNSGQYRAIHTM